MPRAYDESEPPFGTKKRDWTTLYRLVVLVCALCAGTGSAVFLFAGGKYVEAKASETIHRNGLTDIPPRVKRLEERSDDRTKLLDQIDAWRRDKDAVDTRLTALLENQQRMMDRQQQQIDRQQTLVEQLLRNRTTTGP